MTCLSGYFEEISNTLTVKDNMEYVKFLKMRELFREGYYNIPDVPSLVDVSKEDENEEDRLISAWYINYSEENYERILLSRRMFFALEKRFEKFEDRRIKIFISNISEDEKIKIYFNLKFIASSLSRELKIEEVKMLFLLDKIVNNIKIYNEINFNFQLNTLY